MLEALKHDLLQLSSPERAVFVSRFFKNSGSQYGHDDIFIGVSNRDARLFAKNIPNFHFARLKRYFKTPCTNFILSRWLF